jgi:hypothetical protein
MSYMAPHGAAGQRQLTAVQSFVGWRPPPPTAPGVAQTKRTRTTWLFSQTAWTLIVAYLVLGATYAIVLLVQWSNRAGHLSDYRVDAQWSAFAGLFILALTIERVLEPITKMLGPDTDKLQQERDQAVKDADEATAGGNGQPMELLQQRAADAQGTLHWGRQMTAIMTWAVASSLAFILSAFLNVSLLTAVASSTSAKPPYWADLLVTGLVVGAGTKPLHDLVSNVQKASNSKSDPAQVGGAG